jgi:hypothetical protein
MTRDQKVSAHFWFKMQAYERNPSGYEKLFTDIMEAAHSTFEIVKPQGPFGDRKNDGFIPGAGKYYQVYSPEELKGKKDKIT